MTHPSGFERRFREAVRNGEKPDSPTNRKETAEQVEYAHLKPVTHAVWMAQAPRRRWIGAQSQ